MKKTNMIKRTLALWLLLPILLCSCGRTQDGTSAYEGGWQKEPELEMFKSHSFDYFDTVTSLTGYAKSQEQFDAVSRDVMRMLGEYHRLYTIYYTYDGIENLCTLNNKKADEDRVIHADKRIIDMLLFAKEAYTLTGGRVNVAMGSVLSIWHDYREEGMNEPWNASIPPMELLREAAEHTDINSLVIDAEAGTVRITDPEMRLDVGAIAKGYAVEMTARELEAHGITGYVLNVGGNVRTVGTKPQGELWTVGIEDPRDNGQDFLDYLSIESRALVTSGSYQRFYTVGDINYHHIIDTETLMPARGFISVSVVTADSGLADALSTALFCMSIEDGQALVDSLSDVEAAWLLESGERVYSSDFSRHLKK